MQNTITETELKEEICRLAPFHHQIDLPYGLSTYVSDLSRREIEHTRLKNLLMHAFPALLEACGGTLAGKSILDVACNCGGFAVEAARLGADYVLGFDSVGHYVDQANLIKRALGLEQLEFRMMDIEQIDTSTVGQFDITFCFGILYHLENPISAMKRLASVTRKMMLVDTDVERVSFKRRPFSGFFVRRPYWLMNVAEDSASDPQSVSTNLWRRERVVQFRPNETAVVELLRFLGFQKVVKIRPMLRGLENRYYTGGRAAFLATKTDVSN